MNELIPLLNVEDVGASIAFYRATLGAAVENQWELEGRVRWARIRFPGGQLMLNTPDSVGSSERRSRAEFADIVLYLMCDDAPARRCSPQASTLATFTRKSTGAKSSRCGTPMAT